MSKSGAVGYFRVSTAEQSNQNNSLPTQESKFNNFCISNGLTVAKRRIVPSPFLPQQISGSQWVAWQNPPLHP